MLEGEKKNTAVAGNAVIGAWPLRTFESFLGICGVEGGRGLRAEQTADGARIYSVVLGSKPPFKVVNQILEASGENICIAETAQSSCCT